MKFTYNNNNNMYNYMYIYTYNQCEYILLKLFNHEKVFFYMLNIYSIVEINVFVLCAYTFLFTLFIIIMNI